jgi:hypothetical protein
MTSPGAFIKGARSLRRPNAGRPCSVAGAGIFSPGPARRGPAAAVATRRRPLQAAFAAVVLTPRLTRTRCALLALRSVPRRPRLAVPQARGRPRCVLPTVPLYAHAARAEPAGRRAVTACVLARKGALHTALVPLLRPQCRHSRVPPVVRDAPVCCALQEDMLLRQLIAKHGARNWSVIANGIRGRSGKSCRLRWCNQLNPCVKKEPFSEEEDAKIVQACSIAKIGPSLAPLPLTSRLGPHRRTRSTATNGLSLHARCRAG